MGEGICKWYFSEKVNIKIYNEHTYLNIKKALLIYKYADNINRFFFQGIHTYCQEVHEKMLNITNHQGNIN